MSGGQTVRILRNTVIGAAMLIGANPALANDNTGTAMTAGAIMAKMNAPDRFTFVMGVVEGLAYARFVKDTKASGKKDSSGMDCIHQWFNSNDFRSLNQIEAAFSKYANHIPAVVIAALIKRKCGE